MNEELDLKILYHLFGEGFLVGKPMSSPFRRDSSPSLVVYKDKKGFNFYDFGFGETPSENYDMIELLRLVLQFTQDRVLSRIDTRLFAQRELQTLKIPTKFISNTKKIITSVTPNIEVNIGYHNWELEYWSKREQSIDILTKEQILSLKNFHYNPKWSLTSEINNPRFVYVMENGCWKVYSPYDKDNKWKSGGKLTTCIEGWETLPKLSKDLWVVASTKDRLCLKLILSDVINPTAEGSLKALLSRKSLIDDLYDNVYVLFDNDDAGRKHTLSLCGKTQWTPIIKTNYPCIPDTHQEVKDLDDIVYYYNSKTLKNLLDTLL